MDTPTLERVRELLAPLVSGHGLDLYDVESTGGSLRVLVQRAGGVDLELLGDLTRVVSAALDEADPVPGRYTLEVSSPGLERPLRTPRHYAGAVGESVNVKLRPDAEGERRVAGTLVEADGTTIVVDVEGERRRIPLDAVDRARTVFAWGPAAKPGGRGRGQHTTARGATTRKATKR